MDFEGQKLAEIIFHILIISFGAIGWVIGYFQQDFTVVFQCWLVGLVLSVIVRFIYTSENHEKEYKVLNEEKKRNNQLSPSILPFLSVTDLRTRLANVQPQTRFLVGIRTTRTNVFLL